MHPAERLGKYELVRHLASGGMARVYLARVSGVGGFERYVVLKTVRPERIEDQSYVTMFLDEARLVATLHHQHVAQVYEIGVADDGTYFLAMEYLHGETARAVLEHARVQAMRLPLELGLTVACAAAAGLHHAHERRAADGSPLGIVHRDVSPSNVILGYDGSIKLIDFGIAKAEARSTKTLTGFVKGKAGYMAPEQALGYTVDRRSDVFALGVLLYETTTQTRAFRGSNEYESVQRIVAGDVVPPSKVSPGYPPELEDVVMTALAVDPDDRFQDADAMRRALEMTAHHLGIHLGMATVTRVLGELFGERPEPWLCDEASSTGEEMTYVDVESAPMLAAAPIAPLRLTPIPGGALHAAMQHHADGGSVVDEIPTSRFITIDPDAPPTPAAASARKTLSALPPPLPALPPARMATGTAPPKNVAHVAIPALPPGRARTGQVTVPMPIRVATPPPRVVTQPMGVQAVAVPVVAPAVPPAISPSTTMPPATPLPPPVSVPMPAGSGQSGVPGAIGSVPAAVPAATVAATVTRQPSGRVGLIPVDALTPPVSVPRFLPGAVTPGMVSSKVGTGTGTEPAMPMRVGTRVARMLRQRKAVWAMTAAACVIAVGVLAMVVGADGGEKVMFGVEQIQTRPRAPKPPTPTPTPPPASTSAAAAATSDEGEMVTVKVTTSPDGATVVIDGKKVGKTPYVGQVEKGRQAVLKVRKRKHKTKKMEVTFDQDLVWDVKLRKR